MREQNNNSIEISIGKVSELLGISAYTIRYWEKVFSGILVTKRTPGGQRRYDMASIKLLKEVKQLLKEDLYSIAGTRKVLEKKYRITSHSRHE